MLMLGLQKLDNIVGFLVSGVEITSDDPSHKRSYFFETPQRPPVAEPTAIPFYMAGKPPLAFSLQLCGHEQNDGVIVVIVLTVQR